MSGHYDGRNPPRRSAAETTHLVLSSFSTFLAFIVVIFGDRIVDRYFQSPEAQGHNLTKIGAIVLISIAALSGLAYLLLGGRLRTMVLLLLLLVFGSSCLWDSFTTGYGIYQILLPRSGKVEALIPTILCSSVLVTILVSSAFIYNRASLGLRILFTPLLLSVLIFDLWTSFHGNAFFLWKTLNPVELPHNQLFMLGFISFLISMTSLIFSITWYALSCEGSFENAERCP